MPLNARKIAHIKANVAKLHAGRQQQVILTLRNPDGSTSTLTTNAIWRVMIDSEPTMEGAQNTRFHIGAEPTVNAMFSESDVSLSQLRACIWATLGAGATGAQPGTKYVLLDVEPVGAIPGGTRFFTKWTKQR